MIAGGAALAVVAIGAVVWGALALRAPTNSGSTQPIARPAIESPAPTPPAEIRKPTASPAAARETGRASVTETSPPTVRSPESAPPTARPGAPAVAAPPVERAAAAPRPPAPAATPDVRRLPQPARPPRRRPWHPLRRPHRSSRRLRHIPATVPTDARDAETERREQPATLSAPPQSTPSTETDDSRAVIDWLLNPR